MTRQALHDLIDVVEPREFDILYHLLIKFIPEDLPTQDEINAIEIGRSEIAQGEIVDHDDINWD